MGVGRKLPQDRITSQFHEKTLLKEKDLVLVDLLKEFGRIEEDNRILLDIISQIETASSSGSAFRPHPSPYFPNSIQIKQVIHLVPKTLPANCFSVGLNFPEVPITRSNRGICTGIDQVDIEEEKSTNSVEEAPIEPIQEETDANPSMSNDSMEDLSVEPEKPPVPEKSFCDVGTDPEIIVKVETKAMEAQTDLDLLKAWLGSRSSMEFSSNASANSLVANPRELKPYNRDDSFSSRSSNSITDELGLDDKGTANPKIVLESFNDSEIASTESKEPTVKHSDKAAKRSLIGKLTISSMKSGQALSAKQKKLDEMSLENKNLKATIDELTSNLKEQTSLVQEKEEKLQIELDKNAELEKTLSEAQSKEISASKRLEELQRELESIKEQLGRSKNQWNELQNQYKIKTKELQAKDSDYNRIKESSQLKEAESTKKIDKLIEELELLKAELEEVNHQLQNTSVDYENLKQEHSSTLKELTEITNLKDAECMSLQEKIKALMKFPDPVLNPGAEDKLSKLELTELDSELKNYIGANSLRIALLEEKNTEFRGKRLNIASQLYARENPNGSTEKTNFVDSMEGPISLISGDSRRLVHEAVRIAQMARLNSDAVEKEKLQGKIDLLLASAFSFDVQSETNKKKSLQNVRESGEEIAGSSASLIERRVAGSNINLSNQSRRLDEGKSNSNCRVDSSPDVSLRDQSAMTSNRQTSFNRIGKKPSSVQERPKYAHRPASGGRVAWI